MVVEGVVADVVDCYAKSMLLNAMLYSMQRNEYYVDAVDDEADDDLILIPRLPLYTPPAIHPFLLIPLSIYISAVVLKNASYKPYDGWADYLPDRFNFRPSM